MPAPELFRLFIRPLNQLQLPYMVTGAVAAIIYGEPRLTHDVDVVLELNQVDVDRIVAEFPSSDFYTPPTEVLREKAARPLHGCFNLVHLDSAMKADVYLAGSDPLHHWGLPRRQRETIGDEVMWVAPIEYVIVRKLQYFQQGGSERHVRDIRQMLRVSSTRVDRAALAELIGQAAVYHEWHMIEAEPPI